MNKDIIQALKEILKDSPIQRDKVQRVNIMNKDIIQALKEILKDSPIQRDKVQKLLGQLKRDELTQFDSQGKDVRK
jgi:CBS-domain-containing membrane protein